MPPEVPAEEEEPANGRPWQLILFNDDDHTYEYVIEMLVMQFGHSILQAQDIAYEIDYIGQAVVKEYASEEEARHGLQIILDYGPDDRMEFSTDSMMATVMRVEPDSD